MTTFHIPHLGAKLRLTEDFTFTLYNEYRNKDALYEALGIAKPPPKNWRDRPSVQATLPKGTVLTVDRIYIRGRGADAEQYNSVTFKIKKGEMPGKKWTGSIRFWVRLDDLNGELEYEEA